MSRIAALLVITATLLTACTFPRQAETPPPGAIATAVQMTLAAQPTLTPPVETATAVIPSAPTVLATSTPEASATPAFTATAFSEDPAVALGTPTMRDTLDQGTGFGIGAEGYEDDFTRIYLANGALVLHNKSTGGWRGWRLRPPKIQDFFLQASYQVQSCAGEDRYGLIFRAPDFESGHGYYYSLTCDGRYSLSKWDDGGTAVLSSGSALPAYNSGANQSNRIGVLAREKKLSLYVNGLPVAELEDGSLTAGGYFGPFLSGQSGNLTLALDEIAYWSLP